MILFLFPFLNHTASTNVIKTLNDFICISIFKSYHEYQSILYKLNN